MKDTTDLIADGTYFNELEVRYGYAWFFARYSHSKKLYAEMKNAQGNHIGLWAYPNPENPAQYRKEHKK